MALRLTRAHLLQPVLYALGLAVLLLVVVGASPLVSAARPAHFSSRASTRQGLSPAAAPGPLAPTGAISTSRYFAEGHTATSDTEYLTLATFNSVSATVTVTYSFDTSAPSTKNYPVAAHARTTLNINNKVGTTKHGAMAVSSTQPIVAERPLYVTYNGAIPGGTDVLGAYAAGHDFLLSLPGYDGQS